MTKHRVNIAGMLFVEAEKPQLFNDGQLVATPGALELAHSLETDFTPFLVRHFTGDWGDLDNSDKRANDRALKDGTRIFSAYHLNPDDRSSKVWVITEADRSVTTILLPSEY